MLTTAALAALAPACLPRGLPPDGRQIVADRQASLGAIVPPNGDGLLRILLMRPHPGGGVNAADLSVVALDVDNNPSPERLLIAGIDSQSSLGCIFRVAPCSFDSQGRIMVFGDGPGAPSGWLDPVTGEIQAASWGNVASASGERHFLQDSSVSGPTATTGTLVDADGHTTPIDLVSPPAGGFTLPGAQFEFVGEDFYYIDSQGDLIDLPPSDVPQTVAAGLVGFYAQSTPHGPLYTFVRATSQPMVWQRSVRDPVTGHETQLPVADSYTAAISPSFDWMLSGVGSFDGQTFSQTYTLINLHTGDSQELDLGNATNAGWRRGHDEIWAAPYLNDPMPRTIVLVPGRPPITIEGHTLAAFSDDGNAWLSYSSPAESYSSTPAMLVGWADDPTGPLFPYNPPGTAAQYQWTLADGRLMASFSAKDPQRADVIAVDPRTGDRQVLGLRGLVAAVGQTRMMGMFDYQDGRGDLTAVDLQSGQRTDLAAEFAVTAFAEPQGTDQLAPGTRIVYQFQARTASPYDGIWVVSAP